jgi:N-acetyl-anhydromuramyl-L-alanine amidase AmpD
MKYDKMYPTIPDSETKVRERFEQRSHAFSAFDIPIPTASYSLKGFVCRRQKESENTYFYDEKVKKDLIVVHFTVGYLAGDIPALSTPGRHISTSFLLGRDGVLYQLFSSAQWSYHLGRSAIGGNGKNSKRSVGIEVSNIGPLKLSGNVLIDYYGNEYCTLDQKEAYHKLDAPYRGYDYYASFTDKQYDELIILLRYLTSVYDAPRTFLPEETRAELFASSDEANDFKGIASHVNFRTDKFDIGMAFDWQRVIEGVQAEQYQPTHRIASRAFGPLPDINSVEELETEIENHMPGDKYEGNHAEEDMETNDLTMGQDAIQPKGA